MQYLATSNILNVEYKAILLDHKKDMEIQSAKIANEVEEDGNIDAWLDADHELDMKEARSKIRHEHLIYLGPCASDLSSTAIHEAVNDYTKLNLKYLKVLGKGVQTEVDELKSKTLASLKDVKTTFLEQLPKLSTNLKEGAEIKSKIRSMEV